MALWRLISERSLWFWPRFEVTDQAVYKRLHSAGTEPFERIFGHVTAVLYDRLGDVGTGELAPFASEVVCMDESTLDKVARTVPTLRKVPMETAVCCRASLGVCSTCGVSCGGR